MDQSPRRLIYLSVLATALGLLGGGASWVLLRLIALLSNAALLHQYGWQLPSLAHAHPGWWIVPTAMAGGLIVALLAKWSPVIKGHGIPEAMEAVLIRESRIAPRAALAKPTSAAIAIGTGGPFGAEGPIIVTGGALGSLIGQLLHVTPSERKILLAAGAAAGMSATFGAPLASIVLAIELLLFEFSTRAFVPLAVSSSVAAGVHAWYAGSAPLLRVAPHTYSGLGQVPVFAVLGLGAGILAAVVCHGLFTVESGYRRLPISDFWHPVIGGACFGLIGFVVPRALGVGYDAINDSIAGKIAVGTLAALLIAKLLAWWLALGSGTSGGTLAPLLLIGATFGGLYAHAVHSVFPGLHVAAVVIVVVAMSAVFGASIRAPFTAIVFAFELTRDYQSILPIIGAVVIADLVARMLVDHGLMTEKLARRGVFVPRDYAPDVLESRRVAEVMSTNGAATDDLLVISRHASLIDALERLVGNGVTQLRVVDDQERPVGVIALSDILRTRVEARREAMQPGWITRLRRAASQAESRRDPPPGDAPARY
ncbi:MAG TPA: chloride channel protein [Acidimicrobiia bacterium]|nr:chloride channel protein [Acidimicrobiia bacterium]